MGTVQYVLPEFIQQAAMLKIERKLKIGNLVHGES